MFFLRDLVAQLLPYEFKLDKMYKIFPRVEKLRKLFFLLSYLRGVAY